MDLTTETHQQAEELPAADGLMNSPDRFINREFSWLQFNRRVLEETLNTAHPLLERVRFLSISAANLDEFFMVRVAGLEGQVRQSIVVRSPDGKTPAEQLEAILQEIDNLQMEQQASLAVLQQYLAREDILIVRPAALSDEDRNWLITIGYKGDTTAAFKLAEAVRGFGITEGRAVFLEGRRPVTDEEYERQRFRMQLGLTPDPEDVGAIMDDFKNGTV